VQPRFRGEEKVQEVRAKVWSGLNTGLTTSVYVYGAHAAFALNGRVYN